MSRKNKPLISIIVPIYNAEKYLEKCIYSLTNQTYKNIEIILIDDGSTDNSSKIIDNFLNIDNRIIALREDNKGVSFARNTGIDVAKGDYILFVDSDDWIETDMIELMYKEFEKNEKLDICICGYNEYIEEKKENRNIIYFNKLLDNKFIDLILNDENLIKGYLYNKMFRKKSIKNYFMNNIAIKEDLVFLLSNFNNKTTFTILNVPLYNYRINQDSALHSKKITNKKITSLDADIWIIENIKSLYIYRYKISFIIAYYYYRSQLEQQDSRHIKENYEKKVKKYYKEVLRDRTIELNKKLNIIFRRRFYLVYKIWKNKCS